MLVIVRTFRPPFLLLTPVCVFLGTAVVYAGHGEINIVLLLLVLGGALTAHISVNTLNEYLDFRSGLDLLTRRTAFSGGSGALPAHPQSAAAVLGAAIVAIIITTIIGAYLVWRSGSGLLIPGLAGMALIAAYPGYINRRPWLCLIAPGTGFGIFMVAGTQYVLHGEYLPVTGWVMLVPFLLVNNLLLLNQYPDIDADRQSGRRHLTIVYGTTTANIVYALFLAATAAVLGLGMWSGVFPEQSWMALLPLPAGLYALSGAVLYGDNIGSSPQYLAANVMVCLFTPLLLGLAFMME